MKPGGADRGSGPERGVTDRVRTKNFRSREPPGHNPKKRPVCLSDPHALLPPRTFLGAHTTAAFHTHHHGAARRRRHGRARRGARGASNFFLFGRRVRHRPPPRPPTLPPSRGSRACQQPAGGVARRPHHRTRRHAAAAGPFVRRGTRDPLSGARRLGRPLPTTWARVCWDTARVTGAAGGVRGARPRVGREQQPKAAAWHGPGSLGHTEGSRRLGRPRAPPPPPREAFRWPKCFAFLTNHHTHKPPTGLL